MYSLVFTNVLIVGFGYIGKNGDFDMTEKRFEFKGVFRKCEGLLTDI